jgi:hypothetical protein
MQLVIPSLSHIKYQNMKWISRVIFCNLVKSVKHNGEIIDIIQNSISIIDQHP